MALQIAPQQSRREQVQFGETLLRERRKFRLGGLRMMLKKGPPHGDALVVLHEEPVDRGRQAGDQTDQLAPPSSTKFIY